MRRGSRGKMKRKRVMKGVTKKVTSRLTKWTEEAIGLSFFQKYGQWTTSIRPCPKGSLILFVTVIKSPTTSPSICQVNLSKTVDVGMYDAMFIAGLRLPLTKLHRQLANYLGLSLSQIAPNAWRIFIGVEVIYGQLSGGNHRLTLDEFFYCYRPQQISSSKGIYHFLARKPLLRLVSDMSDSNRNWKNRYFFI